MNSVKSHHINLFGLPFKILIAILFIVTTLSLASLKFLLLVLRRVTFSLGSEVAVRGIKEGEVKKIVVVGGSLAGLHAAQELGRLLGHSKDVKVVLVDERAARLSIPLAPAFVTEAISRDDVEASFGRLLESTGVDFLQGRVLAVDTRFNKVFAQVMQTPDEQGLASAVLSELSYDVLLIAVGRTPSLNAIKGAREFAFSIFEEDRVKLLRAHIEECFQRASSERRVAIQRELLSFVVVGASPIGIETAARLREYISEVLLKRYPSVGAELVELFLIDSEMSLLSQVPHKFVQRVVEGLKSSHITPVFNAKIEEIGFDFVTLEDGRKQPTRTCIWCVDETLKSQNFLTQFSYDGSFAVRVEKDGRVLGKSDVFCIGDAATLQEAEGMPYTSRDLRYVFQGVDAARNIVRGLRGETMVPHRKVAFHFSLPLGQRNAVSYLFGFVFTGKIGWLIWRASMLLFFAVRAPSLESVVEALFETFSRVDGPRFNKTVQPRNADERAAA